LSFRRLTNSVGGGRQVTTKEEVPNKKKATEEMDTQWCDSDSDEDTWLELEVELSKRNVNEDLLHACSSGNLLFVRSCLLQGADPNYADEHGRTALDWVGLCGEDSEHCGDIATFLMNNGASLTNEESESESELKRTPLHYAKREAVASVLIEKGLDLNAKDQHSRTPLHFMVLYGAEKSAELLLRNKADVNAKDMYGRTALHYAYVANRKMADLLIAHGADVDATDNLNLTALHHLVKSSHINMEEAVHIIELLASAKANLNLKDELNKTPLDYANEAGHKQFAISLGQYHALSGIEC